MRSLVWFSAERMSFPHDVWGDSRFSQKTAENYEATGGGRWDAGACTDLRSWFANR